MSVGKQALSGEASSKSNIAQVLKDVFQSLAIFMPCFMAQQPSGVQLYLLTSMVFTLAQARAMRNDVIRTAIGLPSIHAKPRNISDSDIVKNFLEQMSERQAAKARGGYVLGEGVHVTGANISIPRFGKKRLSSIVIDDSTIQDGGGSSSSSNSSSSKSKRSKDDTSSSIVITSKNKNEKKIIIKSCYELEKEILNCKSDMNLIGQVLSNITIKSIQSIFNSLLEPTLLYLFLKVIYQYYGIFKVNYIKVLNYYRVVSGLSSFQLQYNLLDSNERSELYEYVQEIKAKVIEASCDSCSSSIIDSSSSNSSDGGTNINKDKDENMIKMTEIEKLFIF